MLYLKKIEIYGFKSFADKLELQFDYPITGIVGPNGCGKSNVSDAIRWVLGEQSTKLLRGKLMQDLIFSGTDTRKSMSYCEVSLFIDNTSRIFPVPMDEIIISRKLYRSNESQYFLNRNVVRLKDILTMLRAVGLGKEGYSIVGQGRMSAILTAKPEDRRAIFEEALSISGFRVKKNETERKLDRTAENIKSLVVLEKELSDRISPLRRQAVTAKKYLELEDQLRYNEINAYIYNYDNSNDLKEKARLKIAGLNEELVKNELEYDKVNEQYDQLFHQLTDIDGLITKLRERQLFLSVDIEKQVGDSKVINEKIRGISNEKSNTEQLIASNNNEIKRLTEENNENNIALEKRLAEQANIENEIAVLNQKLAEFLQNVENTQREVNKRQSMYSDTLRLISENKERKAVVLSEQDNINSRLQQIDKQQTELTTRLTNLHSEEGNLVKHFESVKLQKEQLQQDIEETKKQIKNHEFSLFDARKIVKHLEQEVAGIRGGIELLRDIADNYKGFIASVQNLMQDKQKNSELAKRICGVVANLLDVKPEYQLAIETALGSKLQNIVTENENDAKYIIEYLKQHGYGKITFCPLSSVKPRSIDNTDVLKEKGVVDIASRLVSYDRRYTPVISSLLGGIVIVDTYDNAVAISKKYRYAHNLVTLTGERIFRDGSIEGGSKRSNNSLLSYETQISAKAVLLEEKNQVLAKEDANYKNLEQCLRSLNQKYEQLQVSLNDVNVEIATDRERIETSNTLNNSDKQNILNLSLEKESLNLRQKQFSDELAQLNQTLTLLDQQEGRLNIEIEEFKAIAFAHNASKEATQETLTTKQLRLATLLGNIDITKKSINGIEVNIFKLDDENKRKAVYLSQLQSSLAILHEQLASLNDDNGDRTELSQLTEQIQSSDALKVQLNDSFQTVSNERMRLSAEVESVRSAIDKEEFMLSRIDEDLQELQQRVVEQYGITYSAAMGLKDDNYDVAGSKQRISDLRVAIQKLGYVNVNAIEELSSVEERFGNVSSQMADLQKAESDLKDILRDLTKEIETRFEDGLSQINENFKVIFRELFKGGNAKLVLDKDPDKDPLDYGIEIEAQPPGKHLQNITLLSGGEQSLTAAAILFAILRLHPMPFCVLDEIEAALDDTNAERIARYLKNFSKETQFIVITHKKPTMENADVLYGVTMEEKGVSKIVSVKLNEAVKTAV